jgi:hypothetical protein
MLVSSRNVDRTNDDDIYVLFSVVAEISTRKRGYLGFDRRRGLSSVGRHLILIWLATRDD